jgi:hypothetical protein
MPTLNYAEPNIIDRPASTVSGIVRTAQQFKIGALFVLFVVHHPDSFALCRKGSLFPFFGAPSCRIPGPQTPSPYRMASRTSFLAIHILADRDA